MGRHNFTNVRMQEATALLMRTNKSTQRPPCWYQTMTDYPPTTSLVRPPAVQLYERRHKLKKYRKPSKMFKPQQIGYQEDRLRREFFSDHPWELARPRILVENDGRDSDRWDWSLAHQPGRPVDGDSVVRRQQFLMRQRDSTTGRRLSQADAYDRARKEFYERRHMDEVEARIQREEALVVGAEFGASAMDVGMQLESKAFEDWKSWAHQQVAIQEQARSAAYATLGDPEKEPMGLEDSINELQDKRAEKPEQSQEGENTDANGTRG